MGNTKQWTQEEKQFLADKWGTFSVKTLSLHLNRSETAVNVMKNKLELGRFLEAGDYISLNTFYSVLKGCKNFNSYQCRSWIENRNFPVHTKRVASRSYRVVYLSEFWEWAKENQSFLDFTKFEENILGKEPDWAKEKRKRDFAKTIIYKKSPWQKAEDEKLLKLLREFKYSYKEISNKLARTEGSIQRRIIDLGYKERPVKADNHTKWTAQEIALVEQRIIEGYSYELISKELKRSAKAIRGKVFRHYKTETLDQVRKELKDGKK